MAPEARHAHDEASGARDDSMTADEVAVLAVIDALSDAVRAKDIDTLLSYCAPEIATFDLVPPLKHEGPASVRRLWATTLGPFEIPLEYDIHELDITVGHDVAFCRSLNRFGGTTRDGTRWVSWLSSTIGLRKINGDWKIVHEHVSVPFDMRSGKALLDLAPST
jgi:ketosteroid isomerase-like protein